MVSILIGKETKRLHRYRSSMRALSEPRTTIQQATQVIDTSHFNIPPLGGEGSS
jgi:hypothetical protein